MTLEDPRGPSVIAEAGEEKGQRQSPVTWERTPRPGDGGFRDGGRGRELRGAGGLRKPEKYLCLFNRKVFEVNTTGRRAAFILRLAAPLAPGGWGSPPRRLARLLRVPLKCHFCVKTTGARSEHVPDSPSRLLNSRAGLARTPVCRAAWGHGQQVSRLRVLLSFVPPPLTRGDVCLHPPRAQAGDRAPGWPPVPCLDNHTSPFPTLGLGPRPPCLTSWCD